MCEGIHGRMFVRDLSPTPVICCNAVNLVCSKRLTTRASWCLGCVLSVCLCIGSVGMLRLSFVCVHVLVHVKIVCEWAYRCV